MDSLGVAGIMYYQGVTPYYFNICALIGLAVLNACDYYTHVVIPKSPWWLCRNDRESR